jgi:uncharacterized protein YjiS (DUF1127 family)
MYNLMESRAEALTEEPATWNLARLWDHWLARRSVRRLASYEDRVLNDMGIDRADLDWAARDLAQRDPGARGARSQAPPAPA